MQLPKSYQLISSPQTSNALNNIKKETAIKDDKGTNHFNFQIKCISGNCLN